MKLAVKNYLLSLIYRGQSRAILSGTRRSLSIDSAQNCPQSYENWMAEWSEASVCGAEGPGIDSQRRRSCFFRKMVIARKVAEERERSGRKREVEEREKRKEKRGKRKGERTVKEKKLFFVIFLLVFLFNFYRLSL